MTTSIIVPLAAGTLTFLILVAVWYFVAVPAKRKALAKEAHEKAEKETEVMKQKKLLEVKEKFLSMKSELDSELQQRNQQIQHAENRIKQREITLNQRQDELNRKKQETENTKVRLENQQALLQKKEEEIESRQRLLIEQERNKLEEISGMSAEEARERLIEAPVETAFCRTRRQVSLEIIGVAPSIK